MASNEQVLRLLANGKRQNHLQLGLTAENLPLFMAWIDELSIPLVCEGVFMQIPGGLDLLDSELILDNLSSNTRAHLDSLEVHLSIDSTNTYLMNKPGIQHQAVLCLAEQQTAGRGRRGRQWISPFGSNLYMSLHWSMPLRQSIEGLSLAVGVAVVGALEASGVDGIKLKWPNDLLLENGKLGGILIEMKSPGGNNRVELVIGIGINMKMPEQSAGRIDQAWQDLDGRITDGSRNCLASTVIDALVQMLLSYADDGFSAFREAWLSLDALSGLAIELQQGDVAIQGIERGVDDAGALLVETRQGVQKFHGGEVSLRKHDAS